MVKDNIFIEDLDQEILFGNEEYFSNNKRLMKKKIKDYVNAKESLGDAKKYLHDEGLTALILDDIEDNYVNQKYLKYCYEELIEELKTLLSNKIKANEFTEIISDYQGFIENLIKECEYKKLIDCEKRFDNYRNEIQFKNELLLIVKNFLAQNHIKEYKLIIFLTEVKKFSSSYPVRLGLNEILDDFHVIRFCRNEITLREFIDNLKRRKLNYDYNRIIDQLFGDSEEEKLFKAKLNNEFHEELEKLSQMTEIFDDIHNLFIDPNYPIINPIYVKNISDPTILWKKENETVIEIQKVCIAISKFADLLAENILINAQTKEVRIIAKEIIYIDTDLILPSINVLLFAPKIVVINFRNIFWDLSGKSGINAPQNKIDGTNPGDDGQDGQDGGCGGSGGNLSVVANEIQFETKWIITSNGGDGGNGQPGGDGVKGANGANGREYSLKEIKELFPSFTRLTVFRRTPYFKKAISSILSEFPNAKIHGSFFHGRTYCKAQNEIGGNEIELSYDLSYGDALVLIKGAKGKIGNPGGRGGLGGRGGSGGKKGNVIFRSNKDSEILDIPREFCEVFAENGKSGKTTPKGQSAARGDTGKNGRDSGYCDRNRILWLSPSEFDLRWLKVIDSKEWAIWCWKKGWVKIVEDNENERIRRIYSEDKKQKSDNRLDVVSSVPNEMISNDVINSYEMTELEQPIENQESFRCLEVLNKFENLKEEKLEEVLINTSKPFINSKKLKRNKTEGKANEEPIHKIETLNILDKMLINYLEEHIENFDINKCIECIKNNINESIDEIFLRQSVCYITEKCRFAFLRHIDKNYRNGSNDYNIKSKIMKKLLIPISVTEGFDEAFHCIYGEKNCFNYYECNDSEIKRNEFSNKLSIALRKKNSILELKMHFISSLKDLFENKTNLQFVEKFSNINSEYIKYEKLDSKSKEKYDWNSLAEKETIHEEFTQILKLYNYKLSLSDIRLMALINNNKLSFYKRNDSKEQKAFGSISTFDNTKSDTKNEINICFEEKKSSDSDSYKRKLYRNETQECVDLNYTFKRMGDIIDNCNNLTLESPERIKFFLKTGNLFENISRVNSVDESDNEEDMFYDCSEENIDANDNGMQNIIQVKSHTKDIFYDCSEELNIDSKYIVNGIKSYFPTESVNKLFLNHLKSENINCDILEIIWKRFKFEGLKISKGEMMILILKITKSVELIAKSTIDKLELNKFRWLLSVYPQEKWITELILCELQEIYPKYSINIWRECLYRLENKKVIELLFKRICDFDKKLLEFEQMSDFFELISCENDMNESQIEIFEELSLSDWILKLREMKIEKLFDKIKFDKKDEKMKENILYYLFALNCEYEKTLLKLLEELSRVGTISLKNLEQKLIDLFNGSSILIEPNDLSTFESSYSVVIERFFKTFEGERNVDKLIEVIEKDDKTSLQKELMIKIKKSVKILNRLKETHQKKEVSEQISRFNKLITDEKKKRAIELLALIDRVIQQKRGFKLRDAQKITIILTVMSDKNLLTQVATGEGKSLIVVAIAIFRCILGQTVDVITSSPVLAKRDAEENKDIFEAFGIKVGHNTSEELEERQQQYKESQVIFGDCSCFQRDFLLETFHHKTIRNIKKRPFDCVIVDEVDSMLLDKGNSVLYLSHQPPGFDSLETVFIHIWHYIILRNDSCNPSNVRHFVLSNIYPVITVEDLKIFIDEKYCDKIYQHLIKEKVIDRNGKMIKNFKQDLKLPTDLMTNTDNSNQELNKQENITESLINSHENNKTIATNNSQLSLKRIEKSLNYFISKRWYEEMPIKVPKYLHSFIEQHLNSWIRSGFRALVLEEGNDYVVDVDRDSSYADRNAKITIIDKDTGVDQFNSQWNEGLHQFLEIKHNCKISLVNLKAVFISNIKYFKKYKRINGLTGTLGSIGERKFLEQTYSVDFVNIPLFKSKKFSEMKPILCNNKNEWEKQIFKSSKEITYKNRSVLIICETVNDVEKLYTYFNKNDFKTNLFQYKRSFESFEVTKDGKELSTGVVIIATNLAGRGTDIKISDELNENGGLHVILAYLPDNLRIEQQAFGRSARKGANGSGQMIFVTEEYDANISCMKLKRERDDNELIRISDIKDYYKRFIKYEEEFFDIFAKSYSRFESHLDNYFRKTISENIKNIILNSCLDSWAFFLDRIGDKINNIYDLKSDLYEEIKKFTKKFDKINNEKEALDFVYEPSNLVKLGKCYTLQKNYSEAIKLFDSVIKQEPEFCESAHYYKAMALMNRTESMTTKEKNEFIDCLNSAEKLINQRIITLSGFINIVNKLSSDRSLQSFVTIDAYRKQKEYIIEFYSTLIQSIRNILSHEIASNMLINNEFEKQHSIYLYNYLVEKKILIEKKVRDDLKENDIEEIAYNYGLDSKILLKKLSKTYNKSGEMRKGIELNEKSINSLEKSLDLPNREELWELLLKNKVLINEIKFSVLIRTIDSTEFKQSEDDLKIVKQLKNKKEINNIYFVNNFSMNPDTYIITRERGEKLRKINENVYNNSRAEIDIKELDSILKNKIKFSCIKPEDFMRIQTMTVEESKLIFKNLIDQKFISRDGLLLKTDFKNFNLEELRVYSDEVLGTINNKCVYKIAILRLKSILEELKKENIDENTIEKDKLLDLNVKSKLINDLIMDMLDNKIAIPVHYNRYIKEDKCKNAIRLRKKDFKNSYNEVLKKLKDEKTVEKIAKTLIQFNGKLYTTKTPAAELKDFIELIDTMDKNRFDKIEEINLFTINGFDHIIVIGEKKYSIQMIINCVICVVIGITQIAIGMFLEWYSAGALTHAATGLINEGIGDIIYAFQCAQTGYFDWSDYREHKKRSFAISVVSAGFAAYLSRGAEVSKYGFKAVGNTGSNLAKTAGSAMNEGFKGISKEFNVSLGRMISKRFFEKVGSAFVTGITNITISELSNRAFKKFCDNISDKLLGNIDEVLKKKEFDSTIRELYLKLGKNRTEKLLNEFTNEIQTEKYQIPLWSKYLVIMRDGLSCGLSSASDKWYKHCMIKGEADENLSVIASQMANLQNLLRYPLFAKSMYDMIQYQNTFINDMLKKLKEKMSETNEFVHKTVVENGVIVKFEDEIIEKDFNDFKENIKRDWSRMFKSQLSREIQSNFVEPALRFCAQFIKNYVNKLCKQYYKSRNEKKLRELSEQRKKEIIQNKCDLDENKKTYDEYFEKHKELLSSLQKIVALSRNPNLVADIIEEGGPVGFIEMQAIANLSSATIELTGVDGQKFPYKITPSNGEGSGKTIKLVVEYCEETGGISHIKSDKSQQNSLNLSEFDCLFKALPDDFLSDCKETNEFRKILANFIRNDKSIKQIIENGWHEFYTAQNAIFGFRNSEKCVIENSNGGTKTKTIEDESIYDEEDDDFLANQGRLRNSKTSLPNRRLPNDENERAELASKIAKDLNDAVFDARHSELKNNVDSEQILKDLDKSKSYNCFAITISKDGKKVIVTANIKTLSDPKIIKRKIDWSADEFGISKKDKEIIKETIRKKYPQLKTAKIEIVGTKYKPKSKQENAAPHAEMQQVAYGTTNKRVMGVSKDPCIKCSENLPPGTIVAGGEGCVNKNPKNWKNPKEISVEKKYSIPKSKVSVDHNWHGFKEGYDKGIEKNVRNGLKKSIKSGLKECYTPIKTAPVTSGSTKAEKAVSYAKSNVNYKPTIAINPGTAVETIINDWDREPQASASLYVAESGSYTARCSTGYYARACVGEARAHASIFSASVNGPSACAGVHLGYGTGVAAYASLELARAEVSAGIATLSVGLNANTGASIGLGGVSVSFLGFGLSIGPKFSIKTPIVNLSIG